MGNLGQREKYGLGLVVVLIIAFVIYFAGIRNLQNQKIELEAQRADLEVQINNLQALKDNNSATEANIKAIETEIEKLEATFIPVLNTEVIEKYVIDTFANQGCVYLNSIDSETLVPDTIVLPDGTQADESLQVVRVNVEFATGDGFNFGQYNMTPDYMRDEGRDLANQLMEEQYLTDTPTYPYDESLPLQDYLNFIKGVKEIEKAGIPAGAAEDTESTCIKLSSISMESEGGYMYVRVSIDFYSATFSNRISKPDLDAPYITWTGNIANISTNGEMGRRLVWLESESYWKNIIMVDNDVRGNDRPFAAYWSNASFDKSIGDKGSLALALGLVEVEAPAQPDDTEAPQ